MFFYNKNSLYRLSFFFYSILKKKKLGFKKTQWRLSSYFHLNRMKYFYFFLNKIFLYKKFYFFYFIKKMLSVFFNNIKKLFSFFFLNINIINTSTFSNIILKESIFSNSLHFKIEKKKNIFFNSFFNLYYFTFLLKLFILMFKQLNFSYFSVPLKKNKYTILRSPHIDKKSREQFELKHFYVVLNEITMFSMISNTHLLNFFSFFINSFKLEEKSNYLVNTNI